MTATEPISDRVRSDITIAMKSGERDRVRVLRHLLSELQKSAKEGGSDEPAVLRRERKRRLDAAEQFRDAGRGELADQEESEAETIAGYLPAELSDDELNALVAESIGETGAAGPGDMGKVMKVVMGRVAGRADGKRVSGTVRELLGA